MHTPRLALIVEDDPDAATVASGMFASLGWRCEVAADGREALLRASELQPDVVLLDVYLPGIDGIGVMKVLRRLSEVKPVRVIAASAIYARDSAQGRQLEALGVEGFLHKPFRREELESSLTSIGLPVGAPLPVQPAGRVELRHAGHTLSPEAAALQGTVLELVCAGPGAGDRIDATLQDGSTIGGTVFSAVPEGRTTRCRVALEGATEAQLEALARGLR